MCFGIFLCYFCGRFSLIGYRRHRWLCFNRPSIFTRLNFTETVFLWFLTFVYMIWCLDFVSFCFEFFLNFCVVAHHLLVWVATVKKINIIIIRSNVKWCPIWATLYNDMAFRNADSRKLGILIFIPHVYILYSTANIVICFPIVIRFFFVELSYWTDEQVCFGFAK